MRRLALAVLLISAPPLAAQNGVPWRASYFPYLFGNPSTGPMLVARYQYAQQAGYEERVPFSGVLTVDAGASALGSRFIWAKFRAPLLVEGWRFAADVAASRESRFGFYGLGMGPGDDPPPAPPGEPYPYRTRRARYLARGEVTRHLTGPLRVAGMVGIEHDRWTALPGESAFRDAFDAELEQTDVHGRLSLVVDLRDQELVPSRGILAEAGIVVGTGADSVSGSPIDAGSYAGWYTHLRGYLSPREGTVLAARLAARSVGDQATLAARFDLPSWERDVVALGGPESHRSFVRGGFGGKGLLLAGLEVRHNLLDIGDYGAITLVGFSDAGRVFETTDFELTLSGYEVGYGGGLAVRVLRWGVLTLNFAGGGDGFVFSMGQGWSF